MATKQGGSGSKRRKKGDWIAIARGRDQSGREPVTRGNRDLPCLQDTGSAAYRRLAARRGKH